MPDLGNTPHNVHRGEAGASSRAQGDSCAMTRLLRDDRGAVTTEFTVLVPFFISLMVLFADLSVLYLTHTEMFNAAREISRRMATGELQGPADVQAYAASKLFLGVRKYQVDTDFSGEKRVAISVEIQDAAFVGLFLTPLLGRQLVAIASAGREPSTE